MSDKEFEASLEQLTQAEAEWEKFSPVAVSAAYNPVEHLLQVTLNNGLQLAISPDLLQCICELEAAELQQVQISPMGDLLWKNAGHGIAIRSLLEGRLGSRKWMEQLHADQGIPLGEWSDSPLKKAEWARAAGSMTSLKKQQSSRRNGQKGGRPRKKQQGKVISKQTDLQQMA